MSEHRALSVAVGCLLIAAAVLVYLEWWRAGELELLDARVDELEEYRRRREAGGRKRSSASSSPTTEGA